MAELLKTYPVAPPSIALAMMAWELAYRRAWGIAAECRGPWVKRGGGYQGSAHRHHYEILDRLSRGELP